ncbi:MAG: hypothetical protein N3E36_05600 [Sulfolobales archaeon]|nr:hypothetical protein [Sulfolobales archaeon]MCX8199483.1 hypothetical protein [Sulfolobales archaeon]MDW8170841.1 hypothetical protein [Desulfurococcaceae archaeon]
MEILYVDIRDALSRRELGFTLDAWRNRSIHIEPRGVVGYGSVPTVMQHYFYQAS